MDKPFLILFYFLISYHSNIHAQDLIENIKI